MFNPICHKPQCGRMRGLAEIAGHMTGIEYEMTKKK